MIVTIDDNWRVDFDTLNWTLQRRKVRESGATKGQEAYLPVGYYSTFGAALAAYIFKALPAGSDRPASIVDAIKRLEALTDRMESLAGVKGVPS